ncbi:MAG: rRNA maturation RNase YbeY [Actinomycetota bacterium]|jgi:probable rRNA maturation factor|nr:rRNA maturation RNase YbeY [Actinomycetota bacterium]
MEIRVTSHREPEPLDLVAFEVLARFVLDREDLPDRIELSVAVVDDVEMTELNERYRNKVGPTDVLSFGCDDPCAAQGDEPIALGDVIIAPEVAARQAVEYGNTIEGELNLLLVHGVLHLLGYDHEDDDDAAAMQERERALLAAYADRA